MGPGKSLFGWGHYFMFMSVHVCVCVYVRKCGSVWVCAYLVVKTFSAYLQKCLLIYILHTFSRMCIHTRT